MLSKRKESEKNELLVDKFLKDTKSNEYIPPMKPGEYVPIEHTRYFIPTDIMAINLELEKWRKMYPTTKNITIPKDIWKKIEQLTKKYPYEVLNKELAIQASASRKQLRDFYGLSNEILKKDVQDKIIELHKKGLTYKQITRELKIGSETLWKNIHHLGLVKNPQKKVEEKSSQVGTIVSSNEEPIKTLTAGREISISPEKKSPLEFKIIKPDGTIIKIDGLNRDELMNLVNQHCK
jgi:hypothetical protein